MKKHIVLSGDIIAYTSLSDEEKITLEKQIRTLITTLKNKFSIFGRLIKGDYIEIVVENPEDALTIVLLIKNYIKSISLTNSNVNNRKKSFSNYGIRIAMGYGELSRYDPKSGIIDGEAIYLSGRKINEESTHNKKRIVIKNTLFFLSNNQKLNETINTILSLVDVLLSKATAKQSEILYYKLLGFTEDQIAKKLNVKQSNVNQHSTSVGWNAIEKAVNYFNLSIKEL